MNKGMASALSGLALIVSMNIGAGCATTQLLSSKVRESYAYCTDNRYDQDRRCLEDEIKRAFQSVYTLKVDVATMTNGEERIIASGSGTGLLLKGGYVLTAYHVGHMEKFVKREKLAVLFSRIYLQGPEGREYLLTEVAGDWNADALLAKAPANMPRFQEYPYRIGNSDELKAGDITYLIGNAASAGINMREGIVSQLNVEHIMGKKGFGISNPGNSGDSGGPVLALRDGKIELVGIMVGVLKDTDNLTYAVGINNAINNLRLKNSPLK